MAIGLTGALKYSGAAKPVWLLYAGLITAAFCLTSCIVFSFLACTIKTDSYIKPNWKVHFDTLIPLIENIIRIKIKSMNSFFSHLQVADVRSCNLYSGTFSGCDFWTGERLCSFCDLSKLIELPQTKKGSGESSMGMWAWFTTGWIFVASFGIPAILAHTNVIAAGNCILSITASVIFYGSVLVMEYVAAQQQWDGCKEWSILPCDTSRPTESPCLNRPQQQTHRKPLLESASAASERWMRIF